jgi:hypothetical protein
VSPSIEEDLAALRSSHRVSVVDLGGGDVGVIIDGVRVPPGWNKAEISVFIRVPRAYPQAQLDQFCGDPDLRLASGVMPSNASLTQYAGRAWLQFSYHPRSWQPGTDNLVRYVGFVKGRLMEAR